MNRLSQTIAQSVAMGRLNAIRNAEGWKRPETQIDALVKRMPKWEVGYAER